MLGIGDEISIFLQACLSGGIVFFVYSCIRIVRRIVKHNLFFVSLEDFIFWVGTGLYLFVEIYNTSDGKIRWFFVTGVLAGGIFFGSLILAVRKMYKKFSGKKID